MAGIVDGFWLCFVPLFAALNPISVVPTFNSLVEGLPPERVRRIVAQSMITATAVALAFLAVGKAIFNLLGVSVADFMVAGGLLLFIISLRNLVASDPHRTGLADDTLGAVPIGVPLIVGPATLTTTILLLDQHGAAATIAALLGNLLIVGATLHFAARIQRALGQSGAKALAKIAELLLAAIAVKIIRHGLETLAAGPAG